MVNISNKYKIASRQISYRSQTILSVDLELDVLFL